MFDKDLIVVERRWSVVLGLIAMAAGTLATFGWAHFRQGEARMCAALLEPPTAPAAAQPPETPAAA